MKKIAFYGKGGIGKSTTAANVSAALALQGYKTCQIGCDPKNDSTRLLLGKTCQQTVLEMTRQYGEETTKEQIIHKGFADVQCVEAGGPEPGIGCAGRGIIVALEKLAELGAADDAQVLLYDVLGDVVCGGFAVPIREGYATDIYIVSSGEMMSLYAANNIAKGVARFAGRGKVRLGGIIGNSRNVAKEAELLTAFAKRLNTRLVAFIPRDRIVQQAEIQRKTVIEWAPESSQADVYKQLASLVLTNEELTIPTPLAFEELEELMLHYGLE
ncbi:MAG: nitrogenase iron protein NifH [Sporomusaceae bacterium]|nr:nitrogenase iron protein NifH [Sporomusaceae bacterium]